MNGTCTGCAQDRLLRPYLVVFTESLGRNDQEVSYCDECAPNAVDWWIGSSDLRPVIDGTDRLEVRFYDHARGLGMGELPAAVYARNAMMF